MGLLASVNFIKDIFSSPQGLEGNPFPPHRV